MHSHIWVDRFTKECLFKIFEGNLILNGSSLLNTKLSANQEMILFTRLVQGLESGMKTTELASFQTNNLWHSLNHTCRKTASESACGTGNDITINKVNINLELEQSIFVVVLQSWWCSLTYLSVTNSVEIIFFLNKIVKEPSRSWMLGE